MLISAPEQFLRGVCIHDVEIFPIFRPAFINRPPMHEFVKILFRYHSSILEELTAESLWAIPIDKAKGHYEIDSIPLYAPIVTKGDIVFATYEVNEPTLVYQDTILPSGSSTIQVIMMSSSKDVEAIRQLFKLMGCSSAVVNNNYFVIHVPAALDYMPVKRRLEQLSKSGTLDYAEALLSENHQYV
ncbi:DUF4265 domain-containing protein [Chitinophaga pendula]|uniref:DUF4265 domain-containing protein n=1 Tax=Chitinophaga TaxID=79328 RepID=UPI000BB03440|nr:MULTISPECIES: DUF4265 domain-containing protein [Chitinophaga]ASZ11216.1 hypothetical protein CK934_09690 [Chitinophaga sp. MD30]UCJ05787.1 DUF4265 domain-containing protein [Chitinophaga pendula]